jgi:hypothetical protein
MRKVQAHHGHDEALGREHLVLGEPQHQALQHLVAGRAARFPQQRPQVVAARLAAVRAVELVEGDLRKADGTYSYWGSFQTSFRKVTRGKINAGK